MAKRKKKGKEKSDPWRDRLDEFKLGVHNAFYDSLDKWIESDGEDVDELAEAASDIDPVGTGTNAKAIISEIDAWFREEAETFLSTADVAGKLKELKNRIPPGWLATAMQSHVSAASQAVKQVKNAAEELVEFSQQNSGVGGFLRNAFKGYINPIDGIASFFGEGSTQKEASCIDKNLGKAATSLDEVVATLDSVLDETVVNKWNTEVIALANE